VLKPLRLTGNICYKVGAHEERGNNQTDWDAALVCTIADNGVLTLRDHIKPTLSKIGWKSGSFV